MRAFVVAMALCVLAPSAAATRSPMQEARSGLDTLATLHAANGSFDPQMSPLLVEAAVAVGTDPAAWPSRAHPVLASLPAPIAGGDLLPQLRPIHARAVAGRGTSQDVAAVQAGFQDGQFGDVVLLDDDIWAIRALRALGVPASDDLLQAAARRLVEQEGADGGWSWRLGNPSSTDMTGMALVALTEAQALPPEAADHARAYLAARHANATGGGYPEEAGAANCDSTVWAIRGLQALGDAPPVDAWAFLAALHLPDGGFADQPGQPSNPVCTAEVAALLGEWTKAGRDLSGYSGPAQGAPGLAVAAPVAVLALAVASRRHGL